MFESIGYVQGNCPSCSLRYLATPGSYPSFIPQPLPAIFTPSIPPQPYTASYPPYHVAGITPPGNVPAWIPREIRYENIRGALTPVEHFRAADIGMEGVRGYNNLHGFDNGHIPQPVNNISWNTVHGVDHGPPPPSYVSTWPVHNNGPLTWGPSNNASIPERVRENIPSTTAVAAARATPEKVENGAGGAEIHEGESRAAQEDQAAAKTSTQAILAQDREGSDVDSTSSSKAPRGSEISMASSSGGESSKRGSQGAAAKKQKKKVKISDDVEFVEPGPEPQT
jgi:hypothetical protein